MSLINIWVKNKLHGRSPRANYTERGTAACRRTYCQHLGIEGVALSEIIVAIFYENIAKLTSLPLGQVQSSLMLDRLSNQNCIASISWRVNASLVADEDKNIDSNELFLIFWLNFTRL
jgi:hypothetical protein